MSNASFGIIAPIKKEPPAGILTMATALYNKGMTRMPNTAVYKFPYKELDGKYRTGLDEDAAYIQRIADPIERDIEKERVRNLRIKLEAALGLDLSPRSSYWDYSKSTDPNDTKHVRPVKLIDGYNYFNFSDPIKELEFAWLRVHPTIASSLEAWQRGEYPYDTYFYVLDEESENRVKYRRKTEINKAIQLFHTMAPDTKRKIARLLGLAVTDDTKEEVVYNLIDDLLKQSEFKSGKFVGMTPVTVFMQFATMKEDILYVRDLIKQGLMYSVLKQKGDKIYKGDYKLADSEDDLVRFLMNEDNQEDLIALESEIKAKRLSLV